MATDSQLDERISRWLEAEAPSQLPDRVLRATFERTRGSRQKVAMRALLGRMQMPRSMLALGGVAVVLVAAFVAFNAVRQPGGSGGLSSQAPSPVASPEASVGQPSAAPSAPSTGELPTGPFVLQDEGGVRITVDIPGPGWSGEPEGGIIASVEHDVDPPAGAGMIVFIGDLFVYGDPCEWESTRPATPSTTVEGFVTAMSAQESRDATEAVDITIDGYAGKSITVHVPDDADFSTCDSATFGSWGVPGTDPAPYRHHQGPGQIDKLWVLDVDGTLVVLDTGYYAGTPQAVVDELSVIAESMTFE